jgi:hypothetical protein
MRKLAWAALLLFGCSSAQPAGPLGDEGSSGGGTTRAPDPKDAGYDSQPSLDSGLGVLSFSPDTSYSGFDGMHAFKVPIAVYDAGDDLKVTATDPSAATIAPVKLAQPTKPDGTHDNGRYFMITVKKAGTITLVAESHGKKAQATITATSYPTERWTAGEARYTNAGSNGDPPCTQCHAGSAGIDHSPASMASATDTALGTVITTGISTAGFPIKEMSKGHRWEVSDEERDGLVTYLRGLEPRGFE